jgi:choline dehydrogenase-like flavoprotein
VLLDARDLPDDTQLAPTVCIVGAGAAGITLARALRGSGFATVLLEAGGFELEADTQELYGGASVGLPYYRLDFTRLRYLGGTTNHWTGWCRPLDPIDFEARSWVPNSGWPLSRSELDPYYGRAQEVVELGPLDYSAESWAERLGCSVLPLDPTLATSVLWQFSPPTKFGKRYRAELEQSPDVQTILHANVVHLETDPAGKRATAVRAVTLEGKRLTVRPQVVVLALGAIENARLLLASADAGSSALRSPHDVVGRYFIEHPHANLGVLFTSASERDLALYRDVHRCEHAPPAAVRCALSIPEERVREERLFGFSAALEPRVESPAVGRELQAAVRSLVRDVQRLRVETSYQLFGRIEQAPDPSSRVTLGEERDRLGMRRVVLDWRISAESRAQVRRCMELLAAGVGKARLGRIYSFPHARDPSHRARWPEVIGGHHHMGTTRMGQDPRTSAVDRDLKLHGVENLYVAGSSVFPTGGFSNPTLTIVALALRLGDHLREVTR